MEVVINKLLNIKTDLVSIIIPAYNSKEYLVSSVMSAVNQNYKNIEVILIDDGSTDGTKELFTDFEKLGVKCFSQKNMGAAAARNLGLKNASGDYIQYLDADDILHEDKLLIQLEAMQKDAADLSFCFWGRFTQSVEDVQPFIFRHIDYSDIKNGKDIMRSYGMKGISGAIHSMLVRRDVIEKTGEWNETLTNNDDGEYFTRLYLCAQKVVVVEQQLVYHRIGKAETLSSVNTNQKAESALKSWDLIYQYILKENDKTLLSYPKKGYFVNYRMTMGCNTKYSKIFAKRFDAIKSPFF
ncbi:MAG: glycosyltransferase family 2 protein, partial [Bacteroidetes bacterium]|nr:glycosyltransferase family 2 protein [Bacteroidota bacterium]